MKRIGIPIKGFKFKDGKLIKSYKHLSVSSRLQQRASKKVKVGKR